jgi:hypothetical protein
MVLPRTFFRCRMLFLCLVLLPNLADLTVLEFPSFRPLVVFWDWMVFPRAFFRCRMLFLRLVLLPNLADLTVLAFPSFRPLVVFREWMVLLGTFCRCRMLFLFLVFRFVEAVVAVRQTYLVCSAVWPVCVCPRQALWVPAVMLTSFLELAV